MPACTSESLTKLWNGGSSDSANSTSPSSPLSTSPPVKSPVNTLRRTKILRRTQSTSSTNSFVTEPFIIQSDRRQILAASSQTSITLNNEPLGCRIGVSLPYICHTSVHPRVLWKPCKHFSRQSSGPLIVKSGRYWMPETILNTLRHPSVETVGRLINTVLDKREALFVFWDPLPYCAYYHIQLPFKNIIGFVQRRRAGGNHLFSRTIAAPVH